MVELSPANLELGLEVPLSKLSVGSPEASGSSSGPLDAGGSLRPGGRDAGSARLPIVRLLKPEREREGTEGVVTGGFWVRPSWF